ncbi:MAG TPA: hypothetical protein VMY78_10750 [Solirubrobacteraceae bacterium]|nr:hypothetical protein [Solirubrobacteraceae bacterium]
MSRSAAATSPGRRRALPRAPAPRHPRRISGPVRRSQGSAVAAQAVAYPQPRPQRAPSRPPLRVVAGGAEIALRVADVALNVSGSRAMDRLVRSRAWIFIVGFGLIGIVAMQVSMLKLNAGIGRAVETVNTLERTNASLRGEISRLSDGGRIQSMAGVNGFVMPAPADVTYLRAGNLRSAGTRAARRMTAPDPGSTGIAGSVPATLTEPAAAATAPTQPAIAAPAAPPAATPPATAPAPAPVAAAPPPATPAVSGGAAATAPAAPVAATTASPAGGVAPPTGP